MFYFKYARNLRKHYKGCKFYVRSFQEWQEQDIASKDMSHLAQLKAAVAAYGTYWSWAP